MSYKSIIILGTGSHVGKTTLVTGLCRLFASQGIQVAPFKAQNMSLNSYSTVNGEEIARSTAVQAFAAKVQPTVHMNPILLKPENDVRSQVIIQGKIRQSLSASEYISPHWLKKKRETVCQSIGFLKQKYDLIIAEGAGSCAEPNFLSDDVVNLGLSELLDADAYVVVDIDKGGAFAEILGTLRVLETLAPHYIKRIKGFILNRFRGDRNILQPAIDFITEQTDIPIVGVMPYIVDLQIEEEDRVQPSRCENPEIDIAIVYLPHLSNASDFNPLSNENNVRVRFVRSPETIGSPDMIILPGTKSTAWDLNYIRKLGWEKTIRSLVSTTPLMGICGGLEMMGKSIEDPYGIESGHANLPGLNYFNFTTFFSGKKHVSQVSYLPTEHNIFKASGRITGYEIHSGKIINLHKVVPLYASESGYDGAIIEDPLIFGTCIHDIFKNSVFTRELINFLRRKKNLAELNTPLVDFHRLYDKQYDLLAGSIEQHCQICLEKK